MIHIALTFDSINASAQVGDLVFYIASTNSTGGFNYSNAVPIFLGEIMSIEGNVIEVLYDNINNPNPKPSAGAYIMFAKDKKINNNDMKGYYMSAHFKNNSKDKIELFSVGSHVSESSK
tara:strand:- start:1193 stop:1549 length:357 start_codon:yes stop_codon:yes gene_type:complete